MYRLSVGLVLVLVLGCQHPPVDPSADLSSPDLPAMDQKLPDAKKEGGCLNPPEGGVDLPSDLPNADLPLDLKVDRVPSDTTGDVGDVGVDIALDAKPDATSDISTTGCPPCMIRVGAVCIDRYEASRPDATSSSPGSDNSKAACKATVIPWFAMPLTKAVAKQACAAAGKRLCKLSEWLAACQGPQKTVYSYGNTYEPATCNGIDTFCLCGAGQACAGVTPCPYPHCFSQPPPGGGPPWSCGAYFHVRPTGTFPGCVDAWGVHDLNGNVWELVDTNDGINHFRGGAYNCSDSETLHRCDYDAAWGPSAQGFRCCADPTP